MSRLVIVGFFRIGDPGLGKLGTKEFRFDLRSIFLNGFNLGLGSLGNFHRDPDCAIAVAGTISTAIRHSVRSA